MLSELEKSRTVALCLAEAAKQTLEADRAGGKAMTGDALTREALSRHDYHDQRHGATGHVALPVHDQTAELSAEQREDIQKKNAELRQEISKNEARIRELESELQGVWPSCPVAASRSSEGATATRFQIAVSRHEALEEHQDLTANLR